MTQTPNAAKAIAIETNDIEPIPAADRHGSAWHLFAVWTSANLEYATIFVGIISVLFFGLSFPLAVAALVLGNLAGSLTHGWFSSWGPKAGVPQMILNRTAFGKFGNILPAGLTAITATVGWFAVNSLSGAFALKTLTGLDISITLLIIVVVQIVVAMFGHNLIQLYERVALFVLGAIFVVAAIVIFSQANFNAAPLDGGTFPDFIGFTLAASAAYGYTAGWTPYATDYTRYLPSATSAKRVGLAAGVGMFWSTTFLMVMGAAFVTIFPKGFAPADAIVELYKTLGPVLGALVMLAIAFGAVAANVLNVYSGAMSALAIGLNVGVKARRAIVAVVASVLGTTVAFMSIKDLGHSYEGFLLVIAYWVAPWLGIVATDKLLRRGQDLATVAAEGRENFAGVIAFVLATVLSIFFFSNQVMYTGYFAKTFPIGDLTPVVGFVLGAAIYAIAFKALKVKK